MKAERLAVALDRYPSVGLPSPDAVRGAEPGAEVAYRTRAKLAVGSGGRIGLYAAGTHEVIDLPECGVLSPVIAQAANALRRLLAEASSPGDGLPGTEPAGSREAGSPAGRLSSDRLLPGRPDAFDLATFDLRAVDLREVLDSGDPGVLVTLVVHGKRPPEAEIALACRELERAIPALRGVAISLHDGRSPQLLGRAPSMAWGDALHPDRLSPDAPFSYASAGSFVQAHRAQAAALHRELRRALVARPGRRLLDVFAGSGGLGLALAADGAEVTLVESFRPALEAARQAAARQSLSARIHTRAGDAEIEVPRLQEAGERFDAVVVNPPRRGVAPTAREAIAAVCDGTLAYVACEPETLARDLAHFRQLGWQCTRLIPFDLMPQTREVECLALLERADLPRPVPIFEDAEIVAVEKPAFLATTPHRERAGSLLDRVRAAFAPEAVALHPLDAETSGVCLFAKRADLAPAWQAALADPSAHERYLALVRGRGRAKGRIGAPRAEGAGGPAGTGRYRRLAWLGGHSLLEVMLEGMLETGGSQPLRHQLARLGHPVLGDERHGHLASNRHLAERYWLDRPFLHCQSIELDHPRTAARLQLQAPLPADLAAVVERLEQAPARRATRGRRPRKKSR